MHRIYSSDLIMTWKVIKATNVFTADGVILRCVTGTLISMKANVFSIGDEIISITRKQIKSNPATFEAVSPAHIFDATTYGSKTIHIKFMDNVPTLTADQKAAIGNIIQIWLNNNDG